MKPSAATEPPNPALAELIELLGQDDVRELVGLYLTEFDILIRRLAGGSREIQHRTAHSLKSSARQLGLLELSRMMAALESRLNEPTGNLTPEDILAVTAEFERTAPALRTFAARR
jgi:HPt (histidine-containing phosphotransfer) domain-containing protein